MSKDSPVERMEVAAYRALIELAQTTDDESELARQTAICWHVGFVSQEMVRSIAETFYICNPQAKCRKKREAS